MTKEELKNELLGLHCDIDHSLYHIMEARKDKNENEERAALCRLESLAVGTLQDIQCVLDYLEKEEKK